MDCFGTAVSMSLQYGVPLEVYVGKFSHTRFEPMGHTKNPDIRIAKSIVDYIFRWLGVTFLPGFREANSNLASLPHELGKDGPGDDVEGESQPAAMMAGGQSAKPGSAESPSAERLSPPGASDSSETSGSPSGAAGTNGTNGSNGANGWHGLVRGATNGSAGRNGSQKGGVATQASVAVFEQAPPPASTQATSFNSRSEQFASFQADAPSYDNCGAITVRNGNCYLCHNCGNSMGCS